MITQIDISGFRSIKEASIPLKKLNILYGQNGSGKSSVMYAPYVFRNFCINPNQRLNSLFNLGFMNLGGFENVNNTKLSYIQILLHTILKYPNDINFHYGLELGKVELQTNLLFGFDNKYEDHMPIDLPYSSPFSININYDNYSFLWNGLTFEKTNDHFETSMLVRQLNGFYEQVKNIEIISVRRGFFSFLFSAESPTEESLFAMQIRDQGTNFEAKIDHYFKQLFDKTFRFVAIPGSTSFYLRTQNKRGISTDLVNEGFGVNQTVYMLIKLLKKSTSLAFIEEPEIHLHPSAQAKLVDVFAEIIQNEGKQIFITTHSENIVSSALAKIANGELSRDDVQFYLAVNEDGETKVLPQQVNEKGQIEGGLMNFMEAELSNLKSLLGI